jgi:uncharacterized protein (TIGR03435 family)
MHMKNPALNKPAHKPCALIVTFTIMLAAGTLACAQAPPSFVVATVKPSSPDEQRQGIQMPPGRLSVINMTLQQLIGFAYGTGGLTGPQITGGPSWIDKDRYTIQGEAEGTPDPTQKRLMLKTLLIERFALKTHTASKEINVFNLVLARSDGKLGPGITPWDGMCPGGRAPQPASARGPRCGAFFTPTGMAMTGDSMAVLADMLSTPIANLGRPVVDKTGLKDEYNMTLEYKFPPPGGNNLPAAGPTALPEEPLPPALGTALEEQFGLKLQSAKGMTDVIVVDQAQRPSDN